MVRSALAIEKPVSPAIIITCTSHDFVYIGVPKAATRSIYASLSSNHALSCAASARWISELVCLDPNFDTRYKFTFVRNPFSRVVSIYNNIYRRPGNKWTPDSFAGLKRDMTFRAFVEWLTFSKHGSDEFGDVHWMSQHRILGCDRGIHLDFVGRYENLQADFTQVMKANNVPYWDLPHVNPHRGAPSETDRPLAYRAYYDAYTRGLIERRYCGDLEYLGYEY